MGNSYLSDHLHQFHICLDAGEVLEFMDDKPSLMEERSHTILGPIILEVIHLSFKVDETIISVFHKLKQVFFCFLFF